MHDGTIYEHSPECLKTFYMYMYRKTLHASVYNCVGWILAGEFAHTSLSNSNTLGCGIHYSHNSVAHTGDTRHKATKEILFHCM